MKRIKILYASALVALSFFGAGCNDSESDLLTSKLYFESNVIRVEVEADTYECELVSRLSTMVKSNVNVNYQVGGQDLVDEYNHKHGTTGQLLATDNYEMTGTSSTIKAGELYADPCGLSVKNITKLHDEGIVEECAREKYRLTHKHLPHFEGVADMTATGSIYVRVEGEEKDIFVNQRNTANALNGDRVEVVVMHRGRDGKMEGEITRIVERSRKPYVGIAEVGAHQIFVRADSRRMPMDIYLSKRLYPDVKDGEKVVVRIADWAEGSKSPVGELIERLGMAGNNDTEMHAILAEYELPYRFEPEVEQAAEDIDGRITAKEIAQRRDFRNVTTFTVDPADAKDFDDALSVRKVGEGIWEIGVHIADVTHYVLFALHADERSYLLYDIQLWLYTNAYPDTTEEDYLSAYKKIIALDGEFSTGGYASDFVTDWLTRRKESGMVTCNDGILSMAAGTKEALLANRELISNKEQ